MALTLIPPTAASTDTGWTQLYLTEWVDPALTLTLVGTGTAFVEARGKRTGGDIPLFAGEITWTANGSQAITLPTFAGKVRVSVRILSTSGSIAVSISSPTGTPAVDATGNAVFGGAVVAPEIILDPITRLQIPDPRKVQAVKAALVRGTVAVDIKTADELLIFGSNATTATNSMSTTLMDATISKAVLAEGAALSSAMVSIPHPIGGSASVIAATNAAGFAVTLGE